MEIRQCRRRVEYYTAAIEVDEPFLRIMNDTLWEIVDQDKFTPPLIDEQMVRDSIEGYDEELDEMIFYFKGDFECIASEWINNYVNDSLEGASAFELYDEYDNDEGLEPARIVEED